MRGFKHRTRYGTVYIVAQPGGRWQVVYNEEGLGSYHSAAAAADDVAGGHTFSPSNGVDFADLAISDDVGDWERF